jgi:Putative Actinobacterial Holin-X, holin superfamily III
MQTRQVREELARLGRKSNRSVRKWRMNQVSSAPGGAPDSGDEERSLAELTKQLTEQTTTLARKEVELAKAEMAVKAKRLAVGAGAFGGAGLIGVLAFDALTAAAILGLAEAVDAWLAALIVTAAYAALAGLLAVVGRSRVETGTPAVPEETVESVKEDVEWVKAKAKRDRP